MWFVVITESPLASQQSIMFKWSIFVLMVAGSVIGEFQCPNNTSLSCPSGDTCCNKGCCPSSHGGKWFIFKETHKCLFMCAHVLFTCLEWIQIKYSYIIITLCYHFINKLTLARNQHTIFYHYWFSNRGNLIGAISYLYSFLNCCYDWMQCDNSSFDLFSSPSVCDEEIYLILF